MDTHLRSKSFQRKLLLSVGCIFLLFASCFSAYQYKREKEYKLDIMHSRLQMYNYEMVRTLGEDRLLDGREFRRYVAGHNVEGLRVTVIDKEGKVLLDSQKEDATTLGNHLRRTEVRQALRTGSGYDIKRTSESTHRTYFYSATRFGDIVVRAAVPYSAALTKSLRADYSFLLFGAAITLLLGIALYFDTRRIGRHISCLRDFARKAKDGIEPDPEPGRKLPDDELGEISRTIISLYWKLRHSEEDKLRIKRQLTQNAAHELKTPAASIHGFLESILDNPDMAAEKQRHFLERCYAQSERMNRLLLDMDTLAKLDAPPAPEEKDGERMADVRAIIRNVLDDTDLQLQAKCLTPVLTLPPRIRVHGDPGLIYGIFRNLVDNAIAYATGATKLRVTCIECEGETGDGAGDCFEFAVSDNGPGVAPQHLPHIFERFYRVDKGRSRKLGGTGLGLAIVKNAVAAHGGKVAAEPTPGGGLTIRFTLPR